MRASREASGYNCDPMPRSTHALPLAAAALSAAMFLGMDTAAKLLATRFDTLQLTFLRFASGSLFALPIWLWFRSALPSRARWPSHALRSGLLLLALLTWFYGLSVLPLVQAVAVGFTAPIFISLLAMLVLGERPSRWIWAALALGFAGVMVSLAPELSASAAPGSAERVRGMLAVGISALCYSGTVILARHQAQRDALWSILLVQNLLPVSVLTLALAARAWLPGLGVAGAASWPTLAAADITLVLLLGALATGGLLTITWAFSHIEASLAAPVEYTGLVWAALLGYVVFGEVPTLTSLSSAALIVAGCLLLLRR